MVDTAGKNSVEQKFQDQTEKEHLRQWVNGSKAFDSIYEFHGIVTGLVCHEASPPGDVLLKWVRAQSEDTSGEESVAPDDFLARFIGTTFASLKDTDFTFQPLLPDAGTTLARRVLALTEWCQGFLYGFAAAPGRTAHRPNQETRELLSDLSEISRAGLDMEMSPEEAEDSLIEIIEYVRLAVISLSLEKPATGQPE